MRPLGWACLPLPPALEHACEAYLALNGHELTYDPKDAVALARDAAADALGVEQIARQLRTWGA